METVKVLQNNGRNIKSRGNKTSPEVIEHKMHLLATKMFVPFPKKIKVICKEIGIDVKTYYSWIRSERFHNIKLKMRRELRKKWLVDLDRVVLKRALEGSKFHAELIYKIEGELLTKMEHTHKTPQDIPDDPDELQNEINRLSSEVSSAGL